MKSEGHQLSVLGLSAPIRGVEVSVFVFGSREAEVLLCHSYRGKSGLRKLFFGLLEVGVRRFGLCSRKVTNYWVCFECTHSRCKTEGYFSGQCSVKGVFMSIPGKCMSSGSGNMLYCKITS